jgi:diguanylate cyclase (GGDEF)-like protein
MGLLFFDLDDFKVVNDSLGHEAGDSLLCTIAERLAAVLRAGDLIARFGGDEFVVLCRGIEDETHAADIAERLLAELDVPVRLGGKPVRVTASVGIVVARDGSADTLLRDADLAMYQAKRAGKARIAVFDARERVRVEQHLEIVSGLRQALALGHVGVAYQPIVRQRDRRIVGAEALLRYHHATLGPISALDVINLAERSGCIVELGTNVLTTACRDLAWWRRERGAAAPDYVAVNLAAVQLDQQDLVGLVVDRLERFGLVPSDLCLELTESQLMTDAERGDRVLSDLHRLGVQIAIDDFGTGYSSLAYLRRFPADVVKLDRSFVAGVASEPATAAIIRAVVSLTDTLGFTVAAEGVETREQLECVVDLGCELLQGYGLGRPVPPHEFPLEASWP